jgi:hypothetical protein
MTSWVDRINRAILRRVAPASGVSWDGSGIQLASGQRYRCADLQRAVAFSRPGFIGSTISLALESGGEVILVNETDDAWSPLLAALDADPRTLKRSREWLLVLVANPDAQIEILDGSDASPQSASSGP